MRSRDWSAIACALCRCQSCCRSCATSAAARAAATAAATAGGGLPAGQRFASRASVAAPFGTHARGEAAAVQNTTVQGGQRWRPSLQWCTDGVTGSIETPGHAAATEAAAGGGAASDGEVNALKHTSTSADERFRICWRRVCSGPLLRAVIVYHEFDAT